ncbi:hypothetical protein [Desulfocurvus vexinensis]|uniref:hypothetical protein n=1 Tax=Desulfocurvus vexinensis TaxID=399548 RepID=UPI0004BBC75D|nr:hypothetical protein [Desulfocurvus vexinensis]
MTWLRAAWALVGWRGALGAAGLLAAVGLGLALWLTQARLDSARARLAAEQAECSRAVAALELRLAAAQAEAAALDASARALAGQVRATEAAQARERQRRTAARAALVGAQPVPASRAEEEYAVVDLASSARVAAVLNDVFGGLRDDAADPGAAPGAPGLPEPAAARPGAARP